MQMREIINSYIAVPRDNAPSSSEEKETMKIFHTQNILQVNTCPIYRGEKHDRLPCKITRNHLVTWVKFTTT